MSLLQKSRQLLTALTLILVLAFTTACGATTEARTTPPNSLNPSISYSQLERGNTGAGQEFGDWVVQTSKGLIQDAYVRDNKKLGVVIARQVKPNEVRDLARSLAQGFHKNFPNQDVTVLMYAPDKKLILTARYDQQSNQIQYQ